MLALTSRLLAKPVFGLSSGIVIDLAGIDTINKNHVLVNQNHVLAIVVGQMKSQEQVAVDMCRELQESRDWFYLDYWRQRDVIDDLEPRVANNNADFFLNSRRILHQWKKQPRRQLGLNGVKGKKSLARRDSR